MMPFSLTQTETETPGQRLRVLPVEEWHRLSVVMAKQGGELPHPELANIIVLEAPDDEGVVQLLGFIVVQLVPHVEPIYVIKAMRGTPAWTNLAQAAISQFPPGQQFYAFAPNKAIEAMAESVGLVKLPWSVYKGENLPPVQG